MSFLFLVGCPTATDVTQIFTDPSKRASALANHDPSHNAAAAIAETEHPDNDPGQSAPTFNAGDAVSFYGSVAGYGQTAGLQPATVTGAGAGTDQDGNAVDGYLITVPESDSGLDYNLFVPPTSLRLAE